MMRWKQSSCGRSGQKPTIGTARAACQTGSLALTCLMPNSDVQKFHDIKLCCWTFYM